MESAKRTVLKAIIWQIIGVFSMGIVGVLMTGNVAQGLGIALANTAIGTLTYVIYERLWTRVHWGRS